MPVAEDLVPRSGTASPGTAERPDRAGGRVLVVPASYFARDRVVGGGERYALEYARALSTLVPTTLALFDETAGVERDGSLEVRTFAVRHRRERLSFPATHETVRALARYDVVHSMVFPTPLTDLLALVTRLHGRKLVLTDVGGGGPCWSTYLQRIHPRLSLNRLAHGLALLSEHASSLLADWSQPRTTLYGGVDLSLFSADGAEPEGYALFVGRLLPHKGILEAIRALPAGVPLRVVGRPYDAAYLDALREAARDKPVRFFLDADDRELRRHYAGASVVLQPSLPTGEARVDTTELLGLVTLEAMACGKPVLVTRAGSLPELVQDGETGYVVTPYDAEAMAARVGALVSDAELSRRMGARARERVEQRFTWDRVARRGLDLYHRIGARV